MSETDIAALLAICQHDLLRDVLGVIRDYCDTQSKNMALTVNERHYYGMLRGKLWRCTIYAEQHSL